MSQLIEKLLAAGEQNRGTDLGGLLQWAALHIAGQDEALAERLGLSLALPATKQEKAMEVSPIDEVIEELKWALEELEHTRSDDDYDRVMDELAAIGRLADTMMPDA